MIPDEDLHRNAVENLKRADALLFGRVTYEMMEAAFRPPAQASELFKPQSDREIRRYSGIVFIPMSSWSCVCSIAHSLGFLLVETGAAGSA